ncbi:hypothetical protein [Blastomonas aquatica]|nr:hypothetical protein [Blastomonas aquatica]
MTIEAVVIAVVGVVLATIQIVSASETEKRLDRIAGQLQRLADELSSRN